MSVKYILVFGFLFVSAFAEEQIVKPKKSSQPGKVLEPNKEAIAEVKAEVNFKDVKKDDESFNNEVVKKIENADNSVKASASSSASFNFNFEEFIAKLFQAFQQNKENNRDENNDEEINKKGEENEEAEDKAQSEENQAEKMKSPYFYSHNVHARSSASASSSSSSSSSFYFNFYDPKEGDESENTEIQDENTEKPQKK